MDWTTLFVDAGDELLAMWEGRAGVGCLALPYAMYRVGIVTGVIVLAFVALMTYITVNWIIECSWRANHMEASHLPTLTPLSPPTTSNNTTTYRSPYHQSTLQFFVTPRIQHVLRSNSFKKYGAMNVQNGYEEEEEQHDMNVWMNEQSPTHSSHDGSRPTSSRLRNRILPSHPDSSYTLKQKYEIVQLTELFLGRTYRNIYQCGLCFLMVTGLWAYTTVFLTSVVGKLSFLCSSSSSDHCTLSYALVALLFALIVVPLSCMDLTDQISVQVTLTLVRFVSLGLMIGSAAWGMWYDYTDSGVNTMHTMEQPALLPSPPYAAFTSFHPHSLGLMFTTAVFSHLFQHSVPGLIAPLKNKRSIPYVMIATLLTTFLLYATLSSVCGMYFGSKTLPSINLNWKTFHWGYSDTSSLPVWCHILNYTIVLFPAIDTVSVFPLIAITLGNSLRATVGTRRGNSVKYICRCIASIPPIIGAFFVQDLSLILQIGGIFGLFIALVTPGVLQIASKRAFSATYAGSIASPPTNPYELHFSRSLYVLCVMMVAVIGGIATVALMMGYTY